MNKNAIKKFATEARRELISRVSQRALKYGISEKEVGNPNDDSVNGHLLSSTEKKQRAALIEQIQEKGYEQVMEEVAYTWFNRFSALRFMEVNAYLPSRVRVFTDEDNAFKPQILTEAIHLELDGLDMEKVYAYKEANDNDELYKYLLITQCNALNSVLPGMFQKIADYTELLFPDNLLREGSVIQQMIELIPEDDWKDQVQIIGWLYQYYNSEKKDDVFAALKKNVKITKENIPAATQLFTPDWIVRYMVENSLGRLWLEGHPEVKDQLLPTEEEQSAYAAGNRDPEDRKWHYYLEEAKQEPEVEKQLAEIRRDYAALTPDQLKVIDPCAGSGHILAYMFDVLMQIYESYGYTTRDAVASIVEHNLYGLDIDDRAAQLAYFAVMMKARQYDRRFFSRGIQPHVYAIAESSHVDSFAVEYFCKGDTKLTAAMDTILHELQDAKEYGSILTVTPQDWTMLYDRFSKIEEDIHMSRETALRELLPLVQVAEALAQKYDVVVTNPPYMGASGMSAKLSDFVKKNYPDSKSDLFAVFLERGNMMIQKAGYNCMVTMQSWMFLSSFEKMRTKLLRSETITNLMHMENMVMGIAFGTAVTVARRSHVYGYKGTYNQIKLQDIENDRPKEFPVKGNRFAQTTTDNFSKIPGSPVAYWVSEQYFRVLSGTIASEFARFCKGMDTGDNNRFLRLWHEIRSDKMWYPHKWVPYNKGGAFRRWYGDNEYVINWADNGQEVKNFKGSNIRNQITYLRPGMTWSTTSSGPISIRWCFGDYIYDSKGCMAFAKNVDDSWYILGAMNTKVYQSFMQIITPTIDYNPGPVSRGAIICKKQHKDIDDLVKKNITISKQDWDSFETSWDF